MPCEMLTVEEERVLVAPPRSTPVANEADAVALIGLAHEHQANWIALAVETLHPDFFRLDTGLAGSLMQKFVNYRLNLAVVGNIDAWLARSRALRMFVSESNRGDTVWFVDDLEQLESRFRDASNGGN